MKHSKEDIFKILGKYNMHDGDKDKVWEYILDIEGKIDKGIEFYNDRLNQIIIEIGTKDLHQDYLIKLVDEIKVINYKIEALKLAKNN
jgi:hypothetical protein